MGIVRVRIGKRTLRAKDCKGLASARGLMFDSKSEGALIYANSIWMPFVRHNLDLIFLDGNFRIIEIKKACPLTLNPGTWRIYKCGKARYCLEVKSGIISNLKALIGKKIELGPVV